MVAKPYKGPTPLGPDDAIYGRRDDIDALVDILLSDRIVLLCSASGAGKTSLLEAGLNRAAKVADGSDGKAQDGLLQSLGCMARMRLRGFQVLPKIRVDTPLPKKVPGAGSANRFAFSMLNALEQACTDDAIPPEDVAALDINFYFEERAFLKNTSAPKLMVFDQFEELIHKEPSDIAPKKQFLRQLGRVLENPLYWAIFAMRSEYVTDFDEYLDLIPTGLSSRFTLQLLSEKGAYDAITKPLLESEGSAQISIEENAALKLVSDLAGEKGTETASTQKLSAEPKIEPLHLQVVCDSLWSQAVRSGQNITVDTIKKSGGVDEALAGYFNEQLRKSCEQIASKRTGDPLSKKYIQASIRNWIESTLISSHKTRNSIYEDDERLLKLDAILSIHEILPILCDTYLIRRDVRNQRNLYEIAHDRLVELILNDNTNWFEKNLTPLQQRAKRWDIEKNDKLLIVGKELKDAQKWLKYQPARETELESAFIQASTDLEGKARKQRKLKAALAGSVAVILLCAVGFAVYFHLQNTALTKKSEQNKLLLMANSRTQAWFDADAAARDLITLLTYQKLQDYRDEYKWEGSDIEKKIEKTVRHGIRLTFSAETFAPYLRQVFFANSAEGPDFSGSPEAPLVAAHPTANNIAVSDNHRRVKIFAYGPSSSGRDQSVEIATDGKPIRCLAFRPGPRQLVVVTADDIRFHDGETGELVDTAATIGSVETEPVFSANGRYMATGVAGGRIQLWNLDRRHSRELTGGVPFSPSAGTRIVMAFSRDSKLIAAGDSTGTINVWRTEGTEGVYWTKPFNLAAHGTVEDRETQLVGLGFDADSGGLVTIHSDVEKITLWPLPPKPDGAVRLILDDNALKRAERIDAFRRDLGSIQMKNGDDYVDSWRIPKPDEKVRRRVKPEVIAAAFDPRNDRLHFAVGLDNGNAFIVRKGRPDADPSSGPRGVEMETEYLRFPREVTKLVFANSNSFGTDYQSKKIAGITAGGDVFVVDDVPLDFRREIREKAGPPDTRPDPEAFTEYVCGKAWRNLTQAEWNVYMPPDEPYRCSCPEFKPGFGTGYTRCLN